MATESKMRNQKYHIFSFIPIFVIILISFQIQILYGEDCTLEIKNIEVNSPNNYSYDVFISRNESWTENTALGSLWDQFHSTIVFSVTDNAFSNPLISNLGICINSAEPAFLSDNVLQVVLFSSGVQVPSDSVRLLTITLDINNPDLTAGLEWDELNSIIYKSNNAGEASVEFLGSDNSFLPITSPNYPETENLSSSDKYGLFQNSPNPFYPLEQGQTEIDFNLYKPAEIKLEVFNCLGKRVKVIYQGFTNGGNFTWDGRNEKGVPVSSGVYFYKLSQQTKSPFENETNFRCNVKKMLVLNL